MRFIRNLVNATAVVPSGIIWPLNVPSEAGSLRFNASRRGHRMILVTLLLDIAGFVNEECTW